MADTALPKRVLFVGNSFTFYWNLPQSVISMAKSQKINLAAQQSTGSGATLGEHWNGDKELQTLDVLRAGDFDAVVLQEHGMRSIQDPDSTVRHAKLFTEEIKRKKAKIYIFLPWAREYNPYWQKTLNSQHKALASDIAGAELVPVGLAWQRARELRPLIPIYDADQIHPSPLGTYLTACVFYGALTKKSPVGLPHRLTYEDSHGQKIYLNLQSEGDALFCQHVAEEILQTPSAIGAPGAPGSTASPTATTSLSQQTSPVHTAQVANTKGFAA